jgi:hypothetical protein
MQGIQLGAFTAPCASLDLGAYRTFCDIGGANGTLAAMVASPAHVPERLIELPGGFDHTGAPFEGWAHGAGFDRTEVRPPAGPTSAAIAYNA